MAIDPMSEEAGRLAERIKAIRKSKRLTLNEVEANCGVTASTISKIENGAMSPSYANLLRISKGLGVDIVNLVRDKDDALPKTRRSVSRYGDGPVYTIGTHDYQLLCTDLMNKKMQPMLATIHARSLKEVQAAPGSNGSNHLFSHEGEEILFVFSGEIILHTQHYAPVRMREGDCAYIDSTMGHVCIRGSDKDAKVFWVCSDAARLEALGLEGTDGEEPVSSG